VNKDCVNVTVVSDSVNVKVILDPATDYVSVANLIQVSTDTIKKPIVIDRYKSNNINVLSLSGGIEKWGKHTEKITLLDPEFYTVFLFRAALIKLGVLADVSISKGLLPAQAKKIVTLAFPIAKVVCQLNKASDNLSAENVLKTLGAKTWGTPGTSKGGLYVVRKYLSSIGIDTTKLSVADGSGVSRYNLTSTESIIRLLTSAYEQPRIFPIFYNSLPIAGIDGTLADRMNSYPAYGNLRAKTGTLNGVSCLSGYVQTIDGEMLAFSMMMQHFVTSASAYRSMQDKIGGILASFTRRQASFH
jgi:serine-type D-Ala-D-Ala carboxypeptidase/endopeptidase (penicillin-binding protein 4)